MAPLATCPRGASGHGPSDWTVQNRDRHEVEAAAPSVKSHHGRDPQQSGRRIDADAAAEVEVAVVRAQQRLRSMDLLYLKGREIAFPNTDETDQRLSEAKYGPHPRRCSGDREHPARPLCGVGADRPGRLGNRDYYDVGEVRHGDVVESK